jgi:sugar lactone lactonase YvrE
MSVDSTGNLYVSDEGGLIIRRITPQGVVTTPVGTPDMAGSVDGTGGVARFDGAGLTVGPGDVLYVADTGNNTIRMVSTQDVVTTIAGLASPFLAARPSAITADAAGNVYVANGDLVKISPQGVTTAIPLQTSVFVSAEGAAVGADGTIYVSEVTIVQKISPQGVVTTLAGTPGILGSADGTGSAARFNMTAGIAVNAAGTVYVVDSGNDTIRAITPDGVVSTLAGAPGLCCGDSVDGTGSGAHFDGPFSLALDIGGNLYVGEGQGKIRKVTPQGVVTTLPLASAGLSFNGGTGGSNLSIDGSGNLYVADEYNQVIRKIGPQGAVTTIIGSPARVGLAVAPLPASLANPRGVAVLPSGQLAILDGFAVLVTQGL